MEVKDKIMYHYHKLGFYDDIWQIGNEIIVDDNFIMVVLLINLVLVLNV